MSTLIDFSKGGYQGDVVEEIFKPFTGAEIPHWWFFREVLRASDRAQSYWQRDDGTPLPDEAQKEFVAVSLLNYAVYTGFAEAIRSFEETSCVLNSSTLDVIRFFEVKRLWKATYSHLYSSFNALCNLVAVVACKESPWGNKPGRIWNSSPRAVRNTLNGNGINDIVGPIDDCLTRLEIRDHLDHYWTIWGHVSRGIFRVDAGFSKGYAPTNPSKEVALTVDANEQTYHHMRECARDFDSIYQKLAVEHGFLDAYLKARRWKIDYSDYGEPHNGRRPTISKSVCPEDASDSH